MELKKILTKINDFIEHPSVKEERERKLKKEKEFEKLKEKHPEVERIEELKKDLISSRILTGIGIFLIVLSVYFGYMGDGFFLISIEFIIGLVISIIGAISTNNKLEKIKDLEMNLKQKLKN